MTAIALIVIGSFLQGDLPRSFDARAVRMSSVEHVSDPDDAIGSHAQDAHVSPEDSLLDDAPFLDDAPPRDDGFGTSGARAIVEGFPMGPLCTLLAGGVGAVGMTIALGALGVVFFGSLFVGSGVAALAVFVGLPVWVSLALGVLPTSVTLGQFLPVVFGADTGQDFIDAIATAGLSSLGTGVGFAMGVVGSLALGGVVGAAVVYQSKRDLTGFFQPSTSLDALSAVLASLAILPVGTVVGASTLGVAGAMVVSIVGGSSREAE